MRVIKLSMLVAMMLTSGIITVKAQTADEIIDKHVTAIGGADNWNNLKTVKMVGSLSVQGMDIGFTQTLSVDKAMKTDISAMGMNGFIIVTPNEGYMYLPFQGQTKVDTMKPEMVKMYKSRLDVKGEQLIDYKSKGTKIELLGKDSVNNMLCYKIKVTDKDGTESTAFFDVATYYLMRIESKVKVQDQEQEIAQSFSNYQKQDGGVVMPMASTGQNGDVTFKTIEINRPIDEKVFIPTIEK